MKKEEIKIYSSESIYKQGILNIFKNMFKDLLKSRELIWQLFLRDFKTRYKQSLLGWLWIFIMPLITMGTFLLLNMSGVIKIGDIPVPYPIYGLLGFSLWQIFSNGLTILTGSIVVAGSLIDKINFQRETLIFAGMGQIIVDFLIRIFLVIIIFLFYGLFPSKYFIFFPFFTLPILLLTLGISFITSLLNVIIRDIKDFIGIGLIFFLFLMPVMYNLPEKGLLATINRFNPIFYLLEAPRSIIIRGVLNYPLEFFLSSILALFIFLFGWFIFYISQNKLGERI